MIEHASVFEPDEGQVLRIDVTVDHPSGDPVTLTTSRANY